MLTRILAIAALACLPCAAEAQSQYSTSLRGYINGVISVFESQCYRARGLVDVARTEGDAQKAAVSQLAVDQICTCSPEQGRALLEKLPYDRLAEQVSEEEFLALARKEIIDVCAGRQLRASFGPELCNAKLKRPDFTAEQMAQACECMRTEVNTYSDAESAAIGLAFADYLPELAEAKKANKLKPATPPALERILAAQERCGMGSW
jgi:hypothetical protein